MNWLYIIGGAGAFLTLLGLLYNIFIGKKNATIETLSEKNKWLAEQLELAKANSGDILVEQNIHQALKVADYAFVLKTGELAMQGTGAELIADPKIQKAYMGVLEVQ